MCSDTQRGPTTECQYPGCTRAVWQDPDGSYSSFCGNTHRLAMANNPRSQSRMCKNCNAKPVYIENGRLHDFCGRRCAEVFKNNGQRATHPRLSPTPSDDDFCIIPGCKSRVYVDLDGSKTKFCSNRHRRAAVQAHVADACLLCKEMPVVEVGGKKSDFCSKRCSTTALSKTPVILEIPSTNVLYDNVVGQFTEQWKHPTPVPTVIKLWRIYGDRSVLDRFSRYQLEVERRTGTSGANTRRRFHGTIRACCLGDTSSDRALCKLSACNMCNIIQFLPAARAGERTNFGRFGAGIYTSATSSKANDYYAGSASPNRAMLLNDVVMGKTIKLKTTNTSLTKPPPGYDAVIGEPGGDLNYDECIVYDNDAIRASFLIIYK
ncbi:hypothetical protein B0F90DRAFT_1951105 [Multifurca ochricompacta]|uniref:PARP catalytic domain-containing protein n=1 Tax=Multifurca ochricompacta TaxID=376703 RepID=A0AAD4QKN7_9AGAM|nr:hypothetical protein B0F90DRAFT_1951105 [Multifurca ochricompacta]